MASIHRSVCRFSLACLALLLSVGEAPAAEARPATRPSTQPADVALNLVKSFAYDVSWQPQHLVLDRNPAWTLVRAQPNTVKAAYLGVGVATPEATLRSQLKLPEGAGLVVNFVDEAGPSKEGVKVHDVLQKLDDQLLVNSDQLVTLVRMRKPGDTLRLTLIREAAPVTVEVKLVEKDLPPLQSYLGSGAGDVPAEARGKPAVNSNTEITWLNTFTGKGANDYVDLVATAVATGPMTFDDGEHVLQMRLQGGVGRLVVIEKATGSKLFEGPIGSEEQWKAVPEAVRRKLEGLGQFNPFTPNLTFGDFSVESGRAATKPADRK